MGSIIVGQVLLNRYRVDQYVASGGMASVFRVWDLHRNVPLAMKVLDADLAEDPSMLKRFRREAQAMKKLVHPNIVPFYGLEQTEDTFFLLELYIDGPNLKDILRQVPGHALSMGEALAYLKAICAALGYAHANGVVHCDIKPGNVMVDRGGNIYLTDFGIARHADSSTTTMAGAGTAAYMAPEQIREEAVTPATDVYALGVVLFEMLTGRRPFRGDEESSESQGKSTGEKLRNQHLKADAPDPREYMPGLPEGLAQVILQALSKDPQDRFPSAIEFYKAVIKSSGYETFPVSDRVEVQDDKPQMVTSTPSRTPVSIPQPSSKPNTWVWLSIVGGVICLAVLLMALRGSTQSQSGLPSPTVVVLRDTATPTSQPLAATPTPSTFPSPTDIPSPTVSPTPTSLPVVMKQNPIDQAEMISIPAGTFQMGSNNGESPYFWGGEQPRHKVTLDEYWIYRTEVTNGMFSQCVNAKACAKPANFSAGMPADYFTNKDYANYPVVNVTWEAALSYCQWAKGDLPTEAQWEKAARGTDQRLYPWGNSEPDGSKTNYCDLNCPVDNPDRSVDDGFRYTAPVGNYPQGASPYGVLDMAGNVYEWVYDWYDAGYYQSSPEKNPQGPAGGSTRVARGGSWYNPNQPLLTFMRQYFQPSRTLSFLGFRCVIPTP